MACYASVFLYDVLQMILRLLLFLIQRIALKIFYCNCFSFLLFIYCDSLTC